MIHMNQNVLPVFQVTVIARDADDCCCLTLSPFLIGQMFVRRSYFGQFDKLQFVF